jgi:hypothetical protein
MQLLPPAKHHSRSALEGAAQGMWTLTEFQFKFLEIWKHQLYAEWNICVASSMPPPLVFNTREKLNPCS